MPWFRCRPHNSLWNAEHTTGCCWKSAYSKGKARRFSAWWHAQKKRKRHYPFKRPYVVARQERIFLLKPVLLMRIATLVHPAWLFAPSWGSNVRARECKCNRGPWDLFSSRLRQAGWDISHFTQPELLGSWTLMLMYSWWSNWPLDVQFTLLCTGVSRKWPGPVWQERSDDVSVENKQNMVVPTAFALHADHTM